MSRIGRLLGRRSGSGRRIRTRRGRVGGGRPSKKRELVVVVADFCRDGHDNVVLVSLRFSSLIAENTKGRVALAQRTLHVKMNECCTRRAI
jgi:hypothetical protein